MCCQAYDIYAATLEDYDVLFEAIVDVNDSMIFLQKQNLLSNKGAPPPHPTLPCPALPCPTSGVSSRVY